MVVNDPILLNDWHAVARSQDIQEGTMLQICLLGEDLVLWRWENRFHAMQDYCPHRGARLSLGWIENNTVVCPYHGLAFDSKGHCVRVPASPEQAVSTQFCIQTYQTRERYGLIWVSLGQPEHDIAPFPVWNDPSYRKFLSGPYYYQSSPLRTLENFIDLSHLHFAHKQTLGDFNRPMLNDYQVELRSDGITFGDINVWMHELDKNEDKQYNLNTFNYHIFRPLTARFVMGPKDGRRLSIYYTVAPIDEVESIAWSLLVINYGHEVPRDEFQAFVDKVAAQDMFVVNSQRPKLLPLDLQAEMHLRSDLASVTYRKWLKRLGVTFGTA
jgi:phenylpropionate dioxygenase-like ring-hydroxylating dioxygenase large terminal subunit